MHPKLRRNEIDPMQHLGELFIEFFELYGEKFNSERTAISLRNGGEYFDKFSRGWGPPPHRLNSREQREKFAIEDPQDQGEPLPNSTSPNTIQTLPFRSKRRFKGNLRHRTPQGCFRRRDDPFKHARRSISRGTLSYVR